MKKLPILLLLCFSGISIAQNHTNTSLNTPFIEVTGKAEKEVVPDEIYISIILKERMERGKKVTIDKQEHNLKQQLTGIGIPVENLMVSDVNATILKTGWFKKDIMAVANYTLKVPDASKLKKVYETFEQLKVNKASIKKVSHSRIEELKKENRITAIKAAKEKADYLLSAIGEQTGKPILITENTFQPGFANSLNEVIVTSKYKSDNIRGYTDKSVEFEKIKIVSNIYVKFKIK